jgi:hypothetical protein
MHFYSYVRVAWKWRPWLSLASGVRRLLKARGAAMGLESVVAVAASTKGVDQPLELFFGKQLRRRELRHLPVEFDMLGGHSREGQFHLLEPLLMLFHARFVPQGHRGIDGERVAHLLDILFQGHLLFHLPGDLAGWPGTVLW